jgi:hypothetical protein
MRTSCRTPLPRSGRGPRSPLGARGRAGPGSWEQLCAEGKRRAGGLRAFEPAEKALQAEGVSSERRGQAGRARLAPAVQACSSRLSGNRVSLAPGKRSPLLERCTDRADRGVAGAFEPRSGRRAAFWRSAVLAECGAVRERGTGHGARGTGHRGRGRDEMGWAVRRAGPHGRFWACKLPGDRGQARARQSNSAWNWMDRNGQR